MAQSKFQQKLQYGINKWLKSGEKSGFIELESERVVLASVLGRRSENQDRAIFLRVKFEETSKSSIAALILCDGMGGMVSGGDCANLAISAFAASLVNNNVSTLGDKLQLAVHTANQAVYEDFKGRGGSTLSVVACNDINHWAAVNVGDSRVYTVFKNGTIEQITIDDTLEKQLADLHLPSPPPEFKQLLQYVGMGVGIEPRQIELKLSSDIKWFVITSDGSHSIPEYIFKSILNHAKTPEEVTLRLTQLSEWLGGNDNATVAVLNVEKDLFVSSRDSELSSLEIFGIPGKAEFLSITHSQNNDIQNKKNESEIIEASDTNKQNEREEFSRMEKPSKKSKDRSHKSDLKNVAKSNVVDKGVKDNLIPQLNVEFSEDN